MSAAVPCQTIHSWALADLKRLPYSTDKLMTFQLVLGVNFTATVLAVFTTSKAWKAWIGSCRRELLVHVIVFNEVHLRGLLRDHIS